MRTVAVDSENQSLVFFAFDSNGSAVSGLSPSSDGIAVAVRVDTNGQKGAPSSLTLTTRDVAGVHKDSSITSTGDGRHEIDVADSVFTTLDAVVTLEVSATDVDYVTVEQVQVITTPPTAAAIRTELETDGGKLDHLWETTEDDGGVRRFTTNALEQAPSGGGSATLGNQTTIINSVNAIQTSLSGASTINVTSTVAAGGDVTLHIGSDYRVRQSTSIDIPVTDVGGALRDKLQDSAQVESVIFGAGRGSGANEIVGTVDPADITYASDVSTIKVEVTEAQLASVRAGDDFTYHIKAIAPVESGESVGDQEIIAEGCLVVKPGRAYPTT